MKTATILMAGAGILLGFGAVVSQAQTLPEPQPGSFEVRSNSVFGEIPSLSLDAGVQLELSAPVDVDESLTWEGISIDLLETDEPLQWINPFAPERYGSGEENVVRDPVTDKPSGLKLLSFRF